MASNTYLFHISEVLIFYLTYSSSMLMNRYVILPVLISYTKSILLNNFMGDMCKSILTYLLALLTYY